MAGAAVLGRLTWRVGRVVEVRTESPTARTLVLDVPGWPGHVAGQHLDVRLTAPDGYQAVRSYSMASRAAGERVEITVDELPDGEVSPYLVEVAKVGDPVEVRGPIGGWFVWRPEQAEPVQLVAGGSGMVPLMAMLRTRATAPPASGTRPPMRLVYSVREPSVVLYGPELDRLAAADDGVRVDLVYTRRAPDGWPTPPGRLDLATLTSLAVPAEQQPTCYVCGPTGFVEAAADLLAKAGHDPARIRTERFGGT
jgi:ferredoxin-NADP reductase